MGPRLMVQLCNQFRALPSVLVTWELAAASPAVRMPSIHYLLGNSLVNEHRMTLRTKEIHKPEASYRGVTST